MTGKLTSEDIKKAIKLFEKHAVPPKTIKTRKEARRANRIDKLLGLKSNWKIGDEYYEMHIHPDIIRLLRI